MLSKIIFFHCEDWLVSYSPCCSDNILDKGDFRKEVFILPQFEKGLRRDIVHLSEESRVSRV